jgi:hypothetical protein
MHTSKTPEANDQDRRRLLGTATMGIAVATAASLLPVTIGRRAGRRCHSPLPHQRSGRGTCRPPSADPATKRPERETVADATQGVQLATMRELARYWQTDYDWHKVEARLNALPQFMTKIDGLDIHFIYVRSKHQNALPLIVTHGWPGSIIEQLKIIDPLTNPTAHGASASDAFDVVIPSLPGIRLFGQADHVRLGPHPHRTRLDRADEAPRIHAICGARR